MMDRKQALKSIGFGFLGMAALNVSAKPSSLSEQNIHSNQSVEADDLIKKLKSISPRRDFKEVPIILTEKNMWDDEALNLILAYQGTHKQMWDNTKLDAFAWLNLMREALNAQLFAFKNKDFFQVGLMHGPAHLWLFDDVIWEKYQLGRLTEGKYYSNVFNKTLDASKIGKDDIQHPKGFYSIENNSINAMQERGTFFMACHDSVFAISKGLLDRGINPDKKSIYQVMAELTNHLIPESILTPSIVGIMANFHAAGYTYTAV